MAAKPKYIVDSQNDTGSLDIYVDDVLVTTYTYMNNKVKLSERLLPVDVSLDTLIANISQIFEWIKLIKKIIIPPASAQNRFDEDMKKKATEILASYKYKGNQVMDANFQQGNNYATFAARSEIEMGFPDFSNWANFLLHFYTECKNF